MDSLIQNFLSTSRTRFEIIPVRSAQGKALLPKNIATLPKGARVAITCSEKIGFAIALKTAKRIAELGYTPIPHIPARMVKDAKHLKQITRALEGCGVRDIFVPGGDAPVPAGEFSSSLELLEALNALPHNFKEIGITAYPQGHSDIPDKILSEAFEAKLKHATYAVTQITSGSRAVEKWMISMYRKGINIPIYVGVVGKVERKRLIRVANNFGTKKVIWFMQRNPQIALQAGIKGSYSPDRIVKSLASFGGITGIHFNTFNSVESTETWRKKLIS